ncbi:conjugal transfer protein, partial [Salmonella enterica subsp. enterica]|nr:conjugal transfer protein [Salmonella enterica subsp. enterica serovar Concord]
ALAGMFSATAAQADDGLFTGDVRLACEAVLCLSSGTRPSECAPLLDLGVLDKPLPSTKNAG